MGQWKDERDTILASSDLDPKIRTALECVSLTDPTFFDIPRLRPYFTWEPTSYQQRLRVTYVTALTNCPTPIQAARVHGSIIKHLQEKLKSASLYAAFQDIITQPGHVSDTSVMFEVALVFQWGTQKYAPAHYKPDPPTAARRWRELYGAKDPYKTAAGSISPIVKTEALTHTNSTHAADSVATASDEAVDLADTGDRPAYLAKIRDALRTKLGTQEDDIVVAGQSQAALNTLMPSDNTVSPDSGMRISDLLKDSLDKNCTISHLKNMAEFNDENKHPADHAPCIFGTYGSIRKGMHNHYLLDSDDVVYLGKGTARGVIFPVGHAIPGAHFDADRRETDKVTLEVYLLPYGVLKKLDKVLMSTGDSTSLYTRRTALATMDSGEMLITHVYEYADRMPHEPIPSGDWFEYRKSRE